MPTTSLTHVPDLRGKLKYLLHVRGGNMPGWNYRVTSQKHLALALTELGVNTDEPAVSRWLPHEDIPNLVHVAEKIGRIFRCDEQSFRRDDLFTFIEKTEGTAPSWHILVETAEIDGTISPMLPPAPAVLPDLHPRQIVVDDDEVEVLPELAPGMQFGAALPCPEIKVSAPSPAKLTLLLFSGDRDGYLNWLPRYDESKAFKGLDRLEPGHEIRLPSHGGKLTVGAQAEGRHDIVLVTAAAELPFAVEAGLRAPVKNAALLPTLEQLARWLVPLLQDGRAAIRHRPYYVRA